MLVPYMLMLHIWKVETCHYMAKVWIGRTEVTGLHENSPVKVRLQV